MICRNKKCAKEIPEGSRFCNWCGWKQVLAPHNSKKRGNGQGSVYKLPNGKYKAAVVLGYYNVKDADGKTHLRKKMRTKTCDKAKDAATALSGLMEKAKGYRTANGMTVQALYNAYTNSQKYAKLGRGQQNKLGYAWNRWKPVWHRDITELLVADLQDLIDGLKLTYYPARDMKVIMSHIFETAMRRELVTWNKTECIDLPESPTAKKQTFTEKEEEAFWDDYEGRDKDGNVNPENAHEFTGNILVMIYVGLRYGELDKIAKDNVFLDEHYMIGGIKTEAGTDRILAIADKVLPIVQSMYTKGKSKLLEMNEDNFYSQYWETIERAGIRQLPPQTCRHTYFSRMTAAGVQPGVIAAAGGHADYDTTYKNYVRIPLPTLLDAVNKI